MKILVISAELPFPPIGGGRLRIYHWLKVLSLDHEVTLVAFTFEQTHDVKPPFPLKVICIPWEPAPLYRQMEADDIDVASRAFYTLRDEVSEPWYASYFESATANEILEKEVAKGIDLAFIEDSDMGRFLSLIPDDVTKVLDLQNVYSLMAQRHSQGKFGEELRFAQREAKRVVAFESSVAGKCDLCLACSEEEAAAAKSLLGVDRVAVLPNGVDTTYFAPDATVPSPGTLLFTGSMNYAPNIEAVNFFVSEILPQVHRRRPDIVFHVVGKDPTKQLQQHCSETVRIHGGVPDMRPYFAKAEIFVAPMLSGGGTRLKILEAAAMAKPIITTTLGIEGLDFRPNEDVVVADSPDIFADAIVGLLGATERQKKLGENARHVSLNYDWDRLETELCELVAEAMGSQRLSNQR